MIRIIDSLNIINALVLRLSKLNDTINFVLVTNFAFNY